MARFNAPKKNQTVNQHMKNKTAKNSSSSKPVTKPATKAAIKKAAKATKPAVKKASKVVARPRFFVFGEKSATSVVRALGKLNWKPDAAFKAMGKLAPKLSAVAIRNSLFAGRHGKGAAPAKLAIKELAQLKRLAA